jgi:hypothetical protein
MHGSMNIKIIFFFLYLDKEAAGFSEMSLYLPNSTV